MVNMFVTDITQYHGKVRYVLHNCVIIFLYNTVDRKYYQSDLTSLLRNEVRMLQKITIVILGLFAVAILVTSTTIAAFADDGRGRGGPGGSPGGKPPSDNLTGRMSPPSDNGTGRMAPPSDNVTGRMLPPSDNITGRGPFGKPPSDNVTDNFTGRIPPSSWVPPSDNVTDNITRHMPPPPSDNLTDNFTGHGPPPWTDKSSDNQTSNVQSLITTLIQALAQLFK
jgi:hypothetical protein